MSAAQAVAFYTAREIRLFLDDDSDFGRSSPHAKARSAAAVVAKRAKVRETDVREEARKLMGNLYRAAGVRACVKCGCTDDEGCAEGCFWSLTGEDLCSQCEDDDA